MGTADDRRDSDPGDRLQSLADSAPVEWQPVVGRDARRLESQARREIPAHHVLAGRELTAIRRCPICGDVLFRLDDDSFAIARLNWAGDQGQGGQPDVLQLGSFLAVDLAIAQHTH